MQFLRFAATATRATIIAATVLTAVALQPHEIFAATTSQVMFSYQGRVKVGGEPFNGTGQFKFAIVNTPGDVTLWSQDGTSALGGQPAGSLDLPVADGVFSVMMGDPQVGMQPINPVIFQSETPLRLRVWFNDGSHGFQQLNPDHKLTNLTLTTLETGTEDFAIYVNATTGNDADNGLTPDTAKKTIQAAVDTLPDRIRCNVTIDIADGIYPESVRVFGITVEPGKKLQFIGDETWTAWSTGSPAVQVTGQDSADENAEKVRSSGFTIVQCSGVELKGLEVEGYTNGAVTSEASDISIDACRVTNSGDGVFAARSGVNFINTSANNNSRNGFYINRQSAGWVRDCRVSQNGEAGYRANAFATIQFLGSSQSFSNLIGALAQHHSSFVFTGTLSLRSNTEFGLDLRMNSYTEGYATQVTAIGNGNANQPRLLFGSHTYDF